MKKRHPLIAILLVFAMIFVIMPAPVSAASTVTVKTAQELREALYDATDGTVINLGANIEYDASSYGTTTIAKNITIDFKGHEISFSGSPFSISESGTLTLIGAECYCSSYLVDYNEGTFNIQGTSGDGLDISSYVVYENEDTGKVNIKDAVIEYCYYITEYNYGKLDLTNVTLEADNAVYYNYGPITMTNVNATIDDSLVAYNYREMVLNDVTVDSYDYAFPVEDQYDDYYLTYGTPTCIINGGSFTGDYMNCCFYGYCEINGGAKFVSSECVEIYSEYCPTNFIVNDADFTVDYDNVFYVGSDAATLEIYGGTFKASYSSGYNVINVGYEEDTVILAGGTFTTTNGANVLDGEFDYSNYIIPDGYVTIPEDWQHTSTLTIIPPLYRYSGKNRYETSLKAADALKEQLGLEKFDNVILACGSNYADALAGSYLATVKSAPIILVDDVQKYIDAAQEYINANLKSGGTIYVLGGTKAVPDSAVAGLSGYTITRLKGSNRYATNVAILEEAGLNGSDILVCSGTGFADSLSASATGKPILLVGSSIASSQQEYVSSLSGKNFFIIGGKNAVSLDIESYFANLGTAMRIGGANRFETSTNVARWFFTSPDRAVLAYAMNFPDGLSGGPLAYAMGGPLLLVSNGHSDKAAEYAYDASIHVGSVLGGVGLISDDEVRNVFHLGPGIEVIKK